MALDAATLALTAAELKATLTDAKIAKIFEPTRDELVITLRTRTDTYALLLSARSGSARVCLTEETFENPETPPSFCMLMRKHLTGGRLLDVHMEPGDRIVYFDFQCTNEMGDLVRNTLCAELMGRYSNLVLVQSGKIIDALKRVDFEDSDVRQLLPGLPMSIQKEGGVSRPAGFSAGEQRIHRGSGLSAGTAGGGCPEQDGGRRRAGSLPRSRMARL